MTRYFDLVPGYESLATVYDSAIEQASEGKGRERHANEGEAYENQIICEVARRVGLGYPLGQAVKKIYESQRIGGERGVAELLGALNYVAAAVIVMREGLETAPKAESGCFQNGNNQPEFKRGDKVEVHAMTARDLWELAVVVETYGKEGFYRVEYPDGYRRLVTSSLVRPASRAEGCEALVEKDAPQTREELYSKILESNPSTFGCAHKPTEEELAEMAEEEKRG